MGRPRKIVEVLSGSADDTANGQGDGKPITKTAAVREALGVLGKKAKNEDLIEHIREKHGPAALPANISVAKSAILKEWRQKKGKGSRTADDTTPVGPSTQPTTATPAGIRFVDLLGIKALADRYGKDRIKEVVDLF